MALVVIGMVIREMGIGVNDMIIEVGGIRCGDTNN